jgi:hypothetical protein
MSVDALLKAIDQEIPSDLDDRHEILLEKRDDETLTEAEYAEPLDISNRIEAFGVKRIEALTKLATRKRMDDLGIQSPDVR